MLSEKFAEIQAEHQRLNAELVRFEKEEVEAVRANDQVKTVAVQLQGLDERPKKLVERHKANEGRAAGLAQMQKDHAAAQQQLAGKQQALMAYERCRRISMQRGRN